MDFFINNPNIEGKITNYFLKMIIFAVDFNMFCDIRWRIGHTYSVLAEVILLTLQVRSEKKRLEKDFGQEYLDYKKRVRRL